MKTLIPPSSDLNCLSPDSQMRVLTNTISSSPVVQDVVSVKKFEKFSSLAKFMRVLTYVFRFGLVSLFNGISTLVGYLMPKPFSEKNSSGAI